MENTKFKYVGIKKVDGANYAVINRTYVLPNQDAIPLILLEIGYQLRRMADAQETMNKVFASLHTKDAATPTEFDNLD